MVHNTELTDEEFFLLRVSVDQSVRDFKRYADESPHEEDQMTDNMYAVKYMDLQKKFPSVDNMLFSLDEEGNITMTEEEEEDK
jgi:hypothetical protein